MIRQTGARSRALHRNLGSARSPACSEIFRSRRTPSVRERKVRNSLMHFGKALATDYTPKHRLRAAEARGAGSRRDREELRARRVRFSKRFQQHGLLFLHRIPGNGNGGIMFI